MVRERPEGQSNAKLATGEIEVLVSHIEVLNTSKTPPFQIEDHIEAGEDIRLRYRYLDIRRPRMMSNLQMLSLIHISLELIRQGADRHDVGRRAAGDELHEGVRLLNRPADEHDRLLAAGVRAVAGGLLAVGAHERLEHLGRRALGIIVAELMDGAHRACAAFLVQRVRQTAIIVTYNGTSIRKRVQRRKSMQAQRAEGTKDLIGRDMRAWQRMQAVAADVFGPYGFDAVETPAIEQLDVFVHGIGRSTDVVRKEMFLSLIHI